MTPSVGGGHKNGALVRQLKDYSMSTDGMYLSRRAWTCPDLLCRDARPADWSSNSSSNLSP
jgi:hypothetical protein